MDELDAYLGQSWCVTCGKDATPESLDENGDCTSCHDWWVDNSPDNK